MNFTDKANFAIISSCKILIKLFIKDQYHYIQILGFYKKFILLINFLKQELLYNENSKNLKCTFIDGADTFEIKSIKHMS